MHEHAPVAEHLRTPQTYSSSEALSFVCLGACRSGDGVMRHMHLSTRSAMRCRFSRLLSQDNRFKAQNTSAQRSAEGAHTGQNSSPLHAVLLLQMCNI